jgi:transcriptional regulator with XRE-family HTH domain
MTGRMTGMTRPQRAFYEALGARLREVRIERRMTQAALGRQLGLTGTAISYWESATHEVSAWKLRELERALGERIEP